MVKPKGVELDISDMVQWGDPANPLFGTVRYFTNDFKHVFVKCLTGRERGKMARIARAQLTKVALQETV